MRQINAKSFIAMRIFFITLLIINNLHTMSAQETQDPWSTYMNTSDVHALMAEYLGDFTMEITMSTGEGKPPMVIHLDSHHKMLLGGRFLEMKQSGDMMGMAYEAVTTLGYNTIDKNLSLTTITNMGTGTLAMAGLWENSTKAADVLGVLTNPVSKNTINVRQHFQFVDKDTILIESYDTEGTSAEKKTVEYKLKRKM